MITGRRVRKEVTKQVTKIFLRFKVIYLQSFRKNPGIKLCKQSEVVLMHTLANPLHEMTVQLEFTLSYTGEEALSIKQRTNQ